MKTYLIFIASGIGDFLVAVPMIHTIKQVQPDAIIDIFTCSDKRRFSLTNQLAILQGDVRHAYYYSVGEKIHSLKMLCSLGYHQYDYGIVLEHSNSHYVSSWPSRIVRFAANTTVGAHNPHNSATYDVTIQRPDRYSIYDVEDDLLRAIGIDQSVRANDTYALYDTSCHETATGENRTLDADYHFSSDGHEAVSTMSNDIDSIAMGLDISKGRTIMFCIGAGNAASEDVYGIPSLKSWPATNWIDVANRLAEEGHHVHLLGGGMEQQLIAPYINNLHRDIHNDIGAFTIEESLKAVKDADLVVGVDTGLIHGAALQGTPTLTLFGCSDDIIEKPFGAMSHILHSGRQCSPCLGTPASHQCRQNLCMQDISVEDVLTKIHHLINV